MFLKKRSAFPILVCQVLGDRAVRGSLAVRWSCYRGEARAYLRAHPEPHPKCVFPHGRRRGRAAEGGGLLNRYRVVKPYRGFESPRLRHINRISYCKYCYFYKTFISCPSSCPSGRQAQTINGSCPGTAGIKRDNRGYARIFAARCAQ